MAKKKQQEETKTDAWMGTYSDMVTLLLCFFVLMYSASTPDETKFQYIFQSFNSIGRYINPFVLEDISDNTVSKTDDDGNTDVPANAGDGTQDNPTEEGMGLPHNFDELFVWASSTAAQSTNASQIQVSQTSSQTINITFNNSIMFEGNSAVLLEAGRKELRRFFPGIKAIGDYIKTIRVQGHTATGISDVNDWDLSAARACSVVKYMDFNTIIDSNKYVPEGRANYMPIANNDTEEGRQQNRRVELIITRNDNAISDTAILQDILRYDYGILHSETGVDGTDETFGAGGNSSAVQQIIESINDKYAGVIPFTPDEDSDYTGPSFFDPITQIPDDILLPVEEETDNETEDDSEE